VPPTTEKLSTEATVPKHSPAEVIVGLIVIAGLLSIGYASAGWMARALFGAGGYVVYASFVSASGLHVGDPVKIAGVEVGSVQSVSVENGSARVALRIRDTVRIRKDAVATLRRDWLIGDRTIAIEPGSAPQLLASGELIKHTESQPGIHQLVQEMFAGDLM